MSASFIGFPNEQQREVYEHLKAEIQNWDWESIRRELTERGQYRLGLAEELPRAHLPPAAVSLLTEQDQRTLWSLALLQVVCNEQRLGVTHRSDPEGRGDTIWITLPSPLTKRTGSPRRSIPRATRRERD
jgi:hypothetical protein